MKVDFRSTHKNVKNKLLVIEVLLTTQPDFNGKLNWEICTDTDLLSKESEPYPILKIKFKNVSCSRRLDWLSWECGLEWLRVVVMVCKRV